MRDSGLRITFESPFVPSFVDDRLARQRPTFGLSRPAAGSLVSRGPILPSLRGSEAPGRFGVLGIVYVDAATIPGAQDQLVDSVARRPILTPAVQSPTGESMDLQVSRRDVAPGARPRVLQAREILDGLPRAGTSSSRAGRSRANYLARPRAGRAFVDSWRRAGGRAAGRHDR